MKKITSLMGYVEDCLAEVSLQLKSGAGSTSGKPQTLATGIASLDDALGGGIRRGRLTGALALPGGGARELGVQVAFNAAFRGAAVRAFFPGMPMAEASAHALCLLADVSLSEAHAAVLLGSGRGLNVLADLDLVVSNGFPTTADLEDAAAGADLVVVDAVGSLRATEGHPSLFLRKMARSTGAAVLAIDQLKDGFRFRKSGVGYRDRVDPKSRYDLAILLDRSFTERETELFGRPNLAEVEVVVEDRIGKRICLGLVLAYRRDACFFDAYFEPGEPMVVGWYPNSPSPRKAWLEDCRKAWTEACEASQWERDLDELRRDRYMEAVELAAAQGLAIEEGADYPE